MTAEERDRSEAQELEAEFAELFVKSNVKEASRRTGIAPHMLDKPRVRNQVHRVCLQEISRLRQLAEQFTEPKSTPRTIADHPPIDFSP